jgi:pantothenate kinase type III
MISETINQLKSESNDVEPLIFATGGNADVVLPHIKYKIIFQRDLVLRGLKVIYDLNN